MRAILVVVLLLVPFQLFAQTAPELPAGCVLVDPQTADCDIEVAADPGQYRTVTVTLTDTADRTNEWNTTLQATPILDGTWNGKRWKFRVQTVHGIKALGVKIGVNEP